MLGVADVGGHWDRVTTRWPHRRLNHLLRPILPVEDSR